MDYVYVIMASYYMCDSDDNEWEQWLYLGIEGEHRIFIFTEDIEDRTKKFGTATEAGEYLDKHFGKEKMRCSFNTLRIVEVEV